MEINFKDEYLKFLRHEPNILTPNTQVFTIMVGTGLVPGPAFDRGPLGGGYDGFGVRWVAPSSGSGTSIPAPNEFILKDICDWREVVTFPDLDAFDWEADVKQFIGDADTTKQAVNFGVGNGVYERLASLMGFEEALCAMVTDPEEVTAFFTALTDWKLEYAKRIKKYYHADAITYMDDIATQRDLFMSPETYRELIKPHHKRFATEIRQMGMYPIYHCCGKAEALVEDFIDCGWAAWSSVQTSNDICTLIEQYGHQIGFEGGFDSNGAPGCTDASDEVIRAESRRCIDEYGKYGYGYCFFGGQFVNTCDFNELMAANAVMMDEFMRYDFELLAKKNR